MAINLSLRFAVANLFRKTSKAGFSREDFLLPVFSRCASSATHLSGLFLPQRDPENHVRCAHE
jgi:hypothetical protein